MTRSSRPSGVPRPSLPLDQRPDQRSDQLSVRRSNLSLVLRHLRDAGPRSRARLAEETGLNKATISSLVAELARRGLVNEGAVDRAGTVGRPGLTVEVDGRRACGIGLELNVDYVAVMALDLRGEVLVDRRVAVDVPAVGPERALDHLADLLHAAAGAAAARGAVTVGATVAMPGLVETAPGRLTYAPNLGWTDVPVAAAVLDRLEGLDGEAPGYPVRVDNDANLSAIGEWAMGGEAGTPDLVYLTGEVGVGGGVIVAGRLLRGAHGLSGEVGHMPLGTSDERCGCGRTGCWESVVGLAALLRDAAAADDPVRDPSLDLEQRLREIVRRAGSGDAATLDALRRIGTSLGLGASVLLNLFNPAALVLGGYFAVVGPYLMEPLMTELQSRVIGPDLAGARVVLSTLGFTAAVRGGAYLALERVFDDPAVVDLGVAAAAQVTA